MLTLDQAVLQSTPSPAAWWALGVVSLLTAVLLLLVFRFISNQERIVVAKDRIKAHLLEIRLFRDDPYVVLRAQKDIFLAVLGYVKLTVAPLAVLILPLVYLALHLDLFFAYQPLRPGETALVTVKLDESVAWDQVVPGLTVPEGLRVETPPLRVERPREIDWRVRAISEGTYEIVVTLGETIVTKSVTVSACLRRVMPTREGGRWPATLIAPGEPPLPRAVP